MWWILLVIVGVIVVAVLIAMWFISGGRRSSSTTQQRRAEVTQETGIRAEFVAPKMDGVHARAESIVAEQTEMS
jgi:flagellar basal body-associated protein FliL